MLVKVICISILVICFYLLGEEANVYFRKKHKEVCDLTKLIEIMHMELGFGMYTLEEVFTKLGQRQEFHLSKIFKKLGKDLEENENRSIDEIVDGIVPLFKKTFLGEREVEELRSLILSLGKSDFYSSEKILLTCTQSLKRYEEEAYADVSTKGVLYRKASIIFGLLLAIILI